MKVALPEPLRATILTWARLDHPQECCGLLEGQRGENSYCVTVLHPSRNLSQGLARFEIDPLTHIKAQKLARLRGSEIIGCYHSHPNGRAEPSATDLAGAGAEDFLWLIAAGEDLNAFVYLRGRFTGAEWVTSES